jgi:nucleotide-binding universal stress UspA family protein
VTALEPLGIAPPERIEKMRAAAIAVLDERADQMRRCGMAVGMVVEVGAAAEVLMRQAADDFADLIVVGSRRRGPAASAVLGSVSAHLVDHAECPVLVARSPVATRMLLATDGSESSQRIPHVLHAWGSALRGLPVEVLIVVPRDGPVTPWALLDESVEQDHVIHEGIAARVADELDDLGWQAEALVRVGDPSRQIVDASRETGADLIVTGSRGLSTLRRLVQGSVAHEVLLHAGSSVLVMRGLVPAPVREPMRAFGAAAT